MSRIHVRVDGLEYDVEDMTLDETVQFERETGSSWTDLSPWKSALQCRSILTVFYARMRSYDEAAKVVGGLTTKDAVDHLVLVDAEDDRPDVYKDGLPVVDPKAGMGGAATA